MRVKELRIKELEEEHEKLLNSRSSSSLEFEQQSAALIENLALMEKAVRTHAHPNPPSLPSFNHVHVHTALPVSRRVARTIAEARRGYA